ncbi:MAG: 3-hydroxyacyl-ACP dehydratase FabZ [Nanoarchaeota archaeon]|nr:3-hydroxyacyl-ACP dehydratase FabZ [Nanoarchaeota archaeon]
MKSIDELKNEKGEIDSNAIKYIIPYDQPFLMIDKVESLDKTKIVAIKNTTSNEPFFKGHFAGFPIMPGALIVEGMGQAATLLIRYNLENHWEKEVLAYRIKEAKFSAPTFPGDQLRYEVTMLGKDDRGALISSKAIVNGNTVAEATMMLAVVDRRDFRSKASPIYK